MASERASEEKAPSHTTSFVTGCEVRIVGTLEHRSDRWTYYVHDGQAFCPRRSTSIDVAGCTTCGYLQLQASDADHIVCIAPAGDSVAQMIDTVARA